MRKEEKLLIQLNQSDLEQLIGGLLDEKLAILTKPLPPNPKNKLLTRKQTAKLLGISLPTLSDYTNKGLLVSYRLGGGIRYKEHEVLASLERLP